MRDDKAKFDEANAVIFGVNNNTPEAHKGYCDKFEFTFPLLADADLSTARAYGADKEKGVKRTVVVIDPEGKVAFHKPGMPTDDEILAALK